MSRSCARGEALGLTQSAVIRAVARLEDRVGVRLFRRTARSILLMRTRVLTCASPAYVARYGMPRRPSDVAKHQCVLMRAPSTGSHFGWAFVRGKKVIPVNASGQPMVNDVGSLHAAKRARGLGRSPIEQV